MTTTLKTLLRLPYASHVVPEATGDGTIVYVANHPELSGCMAHGSTPEEALQNLDQARELYITVLSERGIEVPEPSDHAVTAIWRSYPPSPGTTIAVAADSHTLDAPMSARVMMPVR